MRFFLLLILLSVYISLYSQISFQKTIGNDVKSEISYYAMELPSGSFIITNMIKDVTTQIGKPYIIKISKHGDIIAENHIHNSSISYAYSTVLEFNSKILLLSVINEKQNDYEDSIVITQIDTNLQIVNDTKISFKDSLDGGIISFSNVKDSFLLVSVSLSLINQNTAYRPYILTLDTNYSIIDTNYTLHQNNYIRSVINNFEYNSSDSMLYSFYSIYTSFGRNCYKLSLHTDLTLDSLYSDCDLSVQQPIYTESSNGRNYLLARKVNNQVTIYLLDSYFDTISSKPIGAISKLCYPAVSRSLSAKGEYIYAAITEDLSTTDLWWGNQNSNLYVIKMDSLSNKIWDRRIGEDGNYYIMYDVLATQDGGCLLSGCVYNYLTGSEQKDIFLVKLDSAGNTTWIKELPMADAALSVFPNPAVDVLNVNFESTNQTILYYSILDMNAKVVKFNSTNSKEIRVNISSLPVGMYIFECKINDGTIISRKFIKN